VDLPKYKEVAVRVRNQIADGTLLPGQPAPSGAALSRVTGYSTLTCRRALQVLVREGVLVPGTSPAARPRVPSPVMPGERNRAGAARALSGALAVFRRAADLTRPQLAEMIGFSVTSVGHAETGRLWQSRRFWEQADKAVSARGELLALHDAYRADGTAQDGQADPVPEGADAEPGTSPAVEVATSGLVTCVTVTWTEGAVTTVYPPVHGDTRLPEQ
jgi:DNA-binding XRE family transcriptional regulator